MPLLQVAEPLPLGGAGQLTHSAPPVPHWDAEVDVMQVPSLVQQPVQFVELQVGVPVQDPLLHVWPARQGTLVPHWHPALKRLTLQVSAVGPQSTHVAPPIPHWDAVNVVIQELPLQQPVQLVELQVAVVLEQTPLVQV